MSEKINPKQEAFCQAYANIDSKTFSYKAKSAESVGYKSPAQSATQLLNNPVVQARIEQIYSQNAKKHKGRLLSLLEFHRRGAVEAGKWDAANTAVKLQAQIFGFLFESQAGVQPEPELKLSEAEREIYREAGQKIILLGLHKDRDDQENEADLELEPAGQFSVL